MTLPRVIDFVLEDLKLNQEDINQVVDVWYETSIKCHSFISKSFWRANREVMAKLYIPSSQTQVARCNGRIIGFVSLVGNTLASIFVHPDYQRIGVGKALLQSAFSKRHELQLNVYKKNIKAIAFYKKYGFIEFLEGVDENTGERALTMSWCAAERVLE